MSKFSPANYVKAWRESGRITQAELAKKIGLTEVSISRIETGRTKLTEENLARISKALGIRPSDLYLPPTGDPNAGVKPKSKLFLWLQEQGLGYAEFGRAVGLDEWRVLMLAVGCGPLDAALAEAVYRATEGAITPNDLLDFHDWTLPEPSETGEGQAEEICP